MKRITGEMVQAAMTKKYIYSVPSRKCTVCAYQMHYIRSVSGALYKDTSCDCGPFKDTSGHRVPEYDGWLTLCGFEDAAKWINRYNEIDKERIASLFGLDVNNLPKTVNPAFRVIW